MIKLKKSESYMIDENNKLLNKFEFYQLISQKNKKKKISDIQNLQFFKTFF